MSAVVILLAFLCYTALVAYLAYGAGSADSEREAHERENECCEEMRLAEPLLYELKRAYEGRSRDAQLVDIWVDVEAAKRILGE